LTLKGGKTGLLQNSRNICAEKQRADIRLKAQSGDKKSFPQLIKTSCGKKKQ
jgi:hypothetical protein